MDNQRIGILYLSLHNQLVKKIGVNRVLSKKEFFCILGKHFLIPKPARFSVIREMENKSLIKLENKELIKVLDYKLNLERDISRLII